MALTPAQVQQTLIAFQRFGLGPKAGGFAAIGANARAALRAEVNQADIAKITDSTLPSYAVACREGTYLTNRAEAVRRKEFHARVDKHRAVKIGFVERLVLFWSNHFSMTVTKSPTVRSTIGQVERDIIRKHVLGNFADMLIGVTKHPAMLCYLDNASSVGPGSQVNVLYKLGYNENLAREILELHTMGSLGGQTQADVFGFMKILSGWSFVRSSEADKEINGGNQRNRGQYIWRPTWHTPGPISMLGKTYPAVGESQAELVMKDLTRKPATAALVARKLIQHFITDKPTPLMIKPISDAFLRSGGNLKAVALALIDLPEAWSIPLKKIRTPYELAIAQFRALGFRYTEAEYPLVYQSLFTSQHVPWEAPLPTGYPDHSLYWLTPFGMTMRLDTAWRNARVFGPRYVGSIPALAESLYGSALSLQTRERIKNADNQAKQLCILFACPEFQRR